MKLNISEYDIDNRVYLSVVSSNTTLVDYQIEVINNNKELPILNLKVQSINNINKFSFDITGYISLKKYMEKQDVNKNDLLNIVYNITNTIINTENYLLKKGNLILNYENVYINILTKDIKMIYVPVKEKVNEDDYHIIREFLLGTIKIILNLDPTNILVRDIIKYLEKEYYNLLDIKKKIDAINNQEIVPVVKQFENPVQSRVNKNTKTEKGTKKTGSIIAINIVSILLAIVVGVLKLDSIIKVGIIAVIIVVDIAITTLLVVKNKSRNQGKTNSNNILENNATNAAEISFENRTNALISYLYLDGDQSNKKIYINKDIFLIGRLAEVVDYAISNSAIGRVHARIENEEGKYYVTDLASRNGSFMDGNRLNPNQRYLLHDGCQIKFANTVMHFRK